MSTHTPTGRAEANLHVALDGGSGPAAWGGHAARPWTFTCFVNSSWLAFHPQRRGQGKI